MTVRNASTMLLKTESWATWEAHGYAGRGNVAGLVDSCKDRPALVCGGGADVFLDIDEALNRVKDPVIFAVNDIGMFLPKIDHWVSLHHKNMPAWKAVRWLHPSKWPETTYYHSTDYEGSTIDYCWENLTPVMALSGYFAMQIAWIMGCRPILLAGCPGTYSRRFFERERREGVGYGGGSTSSDDNIRNQLIQEMNRLPEFKAAVRSMSGWTREFFGKRV